MFPNLAAFILHSFSANNENKLSAGSVHSFLNAQKPHLHHRTNTEAKHFRRRLMHNTCMWGFGNLKQHSAGLQVSDLKTYEVNVVNIVLGFTEVTCNNDRQALITLK